jgi:hypothetical protein
LIEKLRQIERAVDAKIEAANLHEDKLVRKTLLQDLSDCKQRTSNVSTELRKIISLKDGDLNQAIAKLNDLAFKAINKTSLNKVIDKRAIKNEDLYKKLELEIIDFAKKVDKDELGQKYKEAIDEIGRCPLSQLDAAEAITEGDCLCIGL